MIKQKYLKSSSLLLRSFLIVFAANVYADSVYAGNVYAENQTSATNDTSWVESYDWEAFLSQSAIYSSDYNFFARSDDNVSTDMWEAGWLFSSKFKHDLSVSAQVLGRKVSEFSDEDIRIDYAFLSYPFFQKDQTTLGVRVGRIRSSYGLYNETRDIPHTRTGIIMPQAVYYDMTRNSFYSADGVELYGFHDFDDQRFSFQVFISRPVEDTDEAEEAASLRPKNLEGDKSILAKVAYGSELEGPRVAFTYYRPEYDVAVNFDVNVPPVTNINEENASFYSESMVSSFEYNQFNWSFTAEYLRHKFHTDIPALSMIGADPEGSLYEQAYYVQGLYRFDEQWDSYLRLERSWVRNQGFNDVFFKDVNLGASFRPDEHWLFRAEVHYIEGRAKLLSRDNGDYVDSDPYWTAALFQIAYRW